MPPPHVLEHALQVVHAPTQLCLVVLSVLTLQATGFALTAEQAAAGAIEAAAREGEALREKDEQLAAQAESIATQAETSQLSWRRLLR